MIRSLFNDEHTHTYTKKKRNLYIQKTNIKTVTTNIASTFICTHIEEIKLKKNSHTHTQEDIRNKKFSFY